MQQRDGRRWTPRRCCPWLDRTGGPAPAGLAFEELVWLVLTQESFDGRRPRHFCHCTPSMASTRSIARPLRSAAHTLRHRPSSATARAFATSAARGKDVASDTSDMPNMRHAQRGPQGRLHVPVVNPAGTRNEQGALRRHD